MKNIFTTKAAFKRYFLFLRPLAFLILIFVFTGNRSIAQNSVAIVISPAAASVEVNETFTVDVLVDFASGSLAAVDAYVNFNPLDLEVTAIPTVPAPTQTALPGVSVNFNDLATINALGQIDHGRFTTLPIASHPNTDFVLFSISFRALRVPPGGTTSISFNTVPVRQTLAVENALPILSGTTPGTITINAVNCTTPLATISAPGGTITCNSQSFNLVLASATNGTEPFDVTIEGPDGTETYNDINIGSPITTFTPPTVSIWATPTPTTYDDEVYTLGLRFTSSVAGFVKGIRFFAADEVSAVPGNYTGQLWSDGGTLITSGTFTSVTAGAWNEVLFPSPILINPGQIYVASYHTGTSTFYASTPASLDADFTNGPLTALANGGVFTADPEGGPYSPKFPFSSVQGNYWVDVLFSPNQYTFNLTGLTDADGCTNTGTLQTLNVTSVDCATLPVSLLNLSATPKESSVQLNWSTAFEQNNNGFEVQRRTDAGDWTVIGFVKGAGTTYSTRHYNYTDEKLSNGKYYYRLKQVDINGRYEYSPVVSAVLGGSAKFTLDQNYPNPFRGETIVRFTLPQKSVVKLSLFDMHGRLVRTLVNGSKDKGSHAVTVNSSSLSSGLYYYKLESDNFTDVKKMTIQ